VFEYFILLSFKFFNLFTFKDFIINQVNLQTKILQMLINEAK